VDIGNVEEVNFVDGYRARNRMRVEGPATLLMWARRLVPIGRYYTGLGGDTAS